MASEIGTSYPVSGVNPFSINQSTQGRTYGNQSDLSGAIRRLFGEMPHLKEVTAYENTTQTNHQLPFYFIGQSAYLEEKVKGLTNRSGGWMTDDVLKWAYTRQITFTWDEYHFEHTLVGRVPHQGVPRVVKTGRKSRSERSKRHGIGFVMDASELLTEKGIRQYQNNIRGIVACILETVYLNSIYALLDASERRQRQHMATSVTQGSIHDDFDREIEDFASIAKNPQGMMETIDRKHRLLDMVGAQRVFLITTPESGIYMSQLRSFQQPDPGYLTQGPDAQASKPTQYYDFVIPTNNGPINVYTARDLRTGERGNFIKPLYAEPWIAEYYVHNGRKIRAWPIWDGFAPSDNTVRYITEMRDIWIYSVQKDRDIRISFKKSSHYSLYANEKFLQAALNNGPGGHKSGRKWEEKHFYPTDIGSKYTSTNSLAHDSFARPDEDAYHRYAPSLLFWNRDKSQAGICTHFGMMDSTAMSEQTMRAIGATLGASGNWKFDDINNWKIGVLELLNSLENAPYNEAFFQEVLAYNGVETTNNSRAAALIDEVGVPQLQGSEANRPAVGVLALPPKQEGFPDFPPGFTGYAGLQAIAAWSNRTEDSGWGILPQLASRAISMIKSVMGIIDSCMESEDTKNEHRPINYIPEGSNGKLAAFVQNLVYTDRSPLFMNVGAAAEGTEEGTVSSIMRGQTSFTPSSELVASAMVAGAEDLSKNIKSGRGQQFSIIGSKAGVRNPIVSNGNSSAMFVVTAAGEEAKTFDSLRTRGAHDALANTLRSIRSMRDNLLDTGDLTPEDAVVEPLISDYLESIRGGSGDENTEKHVAGIGSYIEEYKSGKGSDKDIYLKSVKLLKNTIDAIRGDSKGARPSPKSIRAKGEEFLKSGDNMEAPDSSFAVSSANSSFAKGLEHLLKNLQSVHENTLTGSVDQVLNASSSALAYSRSKWPDGNNSDALLLFNPKQRVYNHSISSENAHDLIFSDDISGVGQNNNVISAVYNYSGNDPILKEHKATVRSGISQIKSQSREIKNMLNSIPGSSALSSSKHIGTYEKDIAATGGNEYVMTSLFLTEGIGKSVPEDQILIATGSKDEGYTQPLTLSEVDFGKDKAYKVYLGSIAAEAEQRYIPVKTYENTLRAAVGYGRSGKKIQKKSKFDRFGGSRATGRFSSKISASSKQTSRREMLSSALDTTSFGGLGSTYKSVGDEEGDEFDISIRKPKKMEPLPYSHRGMRGFHHSEPRGVFKWPEQHGARGVLGSSSFKPSDATANLDTSNYREHMVNASRIKNPIVKVLVMAFLSSLCLRTNSKDPWKRLEDSNILTPIGFLELRGQIQHAMENWIMGEPGYRLGANIYSHNQFIVGVDATSMMIYGNLGYYHKSLVYDDERVVLMPYVRPRQYICGSEGKYVTSERQLALNGLARPDIISLGISMEEGELDSAVPILGWYRYPDMNRMMEPAQFTPAYSGYLEFRFRFPSQVTRIMSGYGHRGNRTYRDMLKKFPPVAFQGRQASYNPTAGGVGDFSDIIYGTGHRAGGCKRGCRAVWNGKQSYFPDVAYESLAVKV